MSGLAQRFLESCRAHPEACFLTHAQGEGLAHVTYGEAGRRAGAGAGHLVSRGVRPGDRVAFITPKSPEQIYLFYACWWAGAVAVPVSEGLADAEMAFVLRDAEPGLLVASEACLAAARRNAGGVPVVGLDELSAAAAPAAVAAPAEAGEDTLACLIYTSGSTGRPKGVMLTHGNLLANAEAAIAAICFGPGDSLLSPLPYWHSYALVVELVALPLVGARILLAQDKRDFLRNLARYQPTVILVVPRVAAAFQSAILQRIEESPPWRRRLFARAMDNAARIFTDGPRLTGSPLRRALHRWLYDPLVFRRIRAGFGGRLRFFVSGGAPLDLEPQVFFKRLGIPMLQGYGLTEASPVISANCPDAHKLGSSGRLLRWLLPEAGGDYAFREANGTAGRRLRGELLVKGACVMKGYWRHRDESAKALVNGWLHTGDMGHVDEDGFLFLDGRQGNLIVLVGGEKLHPEHVEDAIKGSPLVADAMVFGERCKNVYAAVTVRTEAAAGLSPEALEQRVRDEIRRRTSHLAPAQRIKSVLILPEFRIEDGTLTVTLKVRRHMVWRLHGDRLRAFLAANGEEAAARCAGLPPTA